MKTIGLIGGMSWESTAHYYAVINRDTAKRRGGLSSAPIVMHSLDFAPIVELQNAGDWQKSGEILAQSAKRLEDAGADVIGLATNTMHMVADMITAAIDVPFIHITDPTAEELVGDGYSKVGLLGTRFTMEMPFYKDRLLTKGITPIVPSVGRTDLNAIIYEELCRGIITEPSRQIYVRAIEQLQAEGAEAVILGCTEIGLLIDDSVSPLPVYDTTQLHAEALVSAALALSGDGLIPLAQK